MESNHPRGAAPVTLEGASVAEMSAVERLKHASEGLYYVQSTHHSRQRCGCHSGCEPGDSGVRRFSVAFINQIENVFSRAPHFFFFRLPSDLSRLP